MVFTYFHICFIFKLIKKMGKIVGNGEGESDGMICRLLFIGRVDL